MAVRVRLLGLIRWLALAAMVAAAYAFCHHAGRELFWSYLEEKPDVRDVIWRSRNRLEARLGGAVEVTRPDRVSVLLAALVWIAAAVAEKYLKSFPPEDSPHRDYEPSTAD